MYYYNFNPYEDRQFLVPFLLGGLAGGAVVSLTRPRPIYATLQPTNQGFNPYMPNGSYSYSYYVPANYNGYQPY